MRSSLYKKSDDIKDPNKTFGNIPLVNSKLKNVSDFRVTCKEIYKSENFVPSEFSADVLSVTMTKKNFKHNDRQFSDIDSNFTSISQAHKKNIHSNTLYEKYKHAIRHNALSGSSKSVFTNVKDGVYHSYNGNDSALSISTEDHDSDESFITKINPEKHDNKFVNSKEKPRCISNNLRLFNKNGKPLTDRKGQPLVDILGQPLMVIDDKGRFSDSKGNQVFNSLGESAIYSSTNINIDPTGVEPSLPFFDVDKKNILFLYDNKGHPLMDSLGRQLVNSSGSLMFGINEGDKVNLNNHRGNTLKHMYSKAPLEDFVRKVQIFDSRLKPLTDNAGKLLENAKIICNKHGMPLCDENGKTLHFKYGTEIITTKVVNTSSKYDHKVERTMYKTPSKSSEDSLVEENLESKLKTMKEKDGPNNQSTEKECMLSTNEILSNIIKNHNNTNHQNNEGTIHIKKHENTFRSKSDENKMFTSGHSEINKSVLNNNTTQLSTLKYEKYVGQKTDIKSNKDIINYKSKHEEHKKNTDSSPRNNSNMYNCRKNVLNHNTNSNTAVILFDASKKMEHKKSQMNSVVLKNLRGKKNCHSIIHRYHPRKKIQTKNFIEYFRNAFNLSKEKKDDSRLMYNSYGIPTKDFYGKLLYDKFGIPLTGAHGKKLDEKARHTLRLKLRNIPVMPKNKGMSADAIHKYALTSNASHNQFGDPYYDKYGRPMYDLFGKLIYDIYGRPLTDAFGRPLIDTIGQPLMDSEGNVLTSVSPTNAALTDIFGRHLYDKRGRALFDNYGRPRFDIFTNAIYDNCGRPTTDGNGNTLYDFLNKAIQPCPEKPLYKNTRALLPRYIDRILSMPGIYRVLKYSRASLKDVFGGPLFDDFGKPLYNKIGKPLYDRYGRPLYDKNGRPLCDCYGRPLSDEIRDSADDQTLSVIDSLKLLRLTKESSKWIEMKRSQIKGLKSSDTEVLGKRLLSLYFSQIH